ncbi:MAG: hypothetical protein K6C12_00870 [Oscillospiraceae bacterium]|nr:hypothetical protein [Oscillospiraceae bacterium]
MARVEPICSNQDCRDRFAQFGLTYDDITEGDILALVMLLNREIRKSNKAGETSVNTTRLSSKMTIKHKPTGQITECYLFMNSHYYTQRECISFNKDGFIGFAGWADDGNTNPIRRAFLEWCGLMAAQKAATWPDHGTITIPLSEPSTAEMLKFMERLDAEQRRQMFEPGNRFFLECGGRKIEYVAQEARNELRRI